MKSKSDAGFKPSNSFVYFFLTPWWRLLWFLGAVAWCIALNAVFIGGGGSNQWLGLASVAPIIAFLVDQLRRNGARHHTEGDQSRPVAQKQRELS
jgi:hypothetical protein